MASILTTKIAGIVGGISGISAIGGAVIYLSSGQTKTQTEDKPKVVVTKQSVSKLLESETDVVLIGQEKSTGNPWGAAWTKFKNEYQAKTVPKNWSILETKKTQSDIPAEFKTLCKTNSEQEIENKTAEIYKEVKNYCTKAKGVG